MRKALTLSAIAVVASIGLAAPATAFAADATPAPAPSKSASAKSDEGSATPVVSITSSPKDKTGYKAGDKVTAKVTTSGKAKVTASSDALSGISVTPGNGGNDYLVTGTVKSGYGIGTATLKVTANYGDTGAEGSASFSVNTGGVKPDPGKASMSLSTDGGKAGDKVQVEIKTGDLQGTPYVKSDVFGGKVSLTPKPGSKGVWGGTATVAKDVKSGYYKVDGYVGNQLVDSAKFGVQGSDTPAPKPGQSSLALSPGSGKSGDKIDLTLTGSGNPQSSYSANSAAFGGNVKLTLGKDGKWHGQATVANVKVGAYKVTANSGATATFNVTDKHVSPVKPVNPRTTRPRRARSTPVWPRPPAARPTPVTSPWAPASPPSVRPV